MRACSSSGESFSLNPSLQGLHARTDSKFYTSKDFLLESTSLQVSSPEAQSKFSNNDFLPENASLQVHSLKAQSKFSNSTDFLTENTSLQVPFPKAQSKISASGVHSRNASLQVFPGVEQPKFSDKDSLLPDTSLQEFSGEEQFSFGSSHIVPEFVPTSLQVSVHSSGTHRTSNSLLVDKGSHSPCESLSGNPQQEDVAPGNSQPSCLLPAPSNIVPSSLQDGSLSGGVREKIKGYEDISGGPSNTTGTAGTAPPLSPGYP